MGGFDNSVTDHLLSIFIIIQNLNLILRLEVPLATPQFIVFFSVMMVICGNLNILQVEAQEATITEISKLCDVTEALCDAEEQRLKQPFIDLPIWEQSPKDLIRSLLEE